MPRAIWTTIRRTRMSDFNRLRAGTAFLGVAATLLVGTASAGPVLLTGHDPDFHAQVQQSGVDQLNIYLNFVTGGTYNTGAEKFLFVESNLPPTAGHFVGENGLTAIGL